MQNRAIENAISTALAAGPDATLDLLQHKLKETPGFDLFTILAARPGNRYLERLYSTNKEQYPVGKADDVEDNIWFQRLFSEKQPIVANTLDEISQWIVNYQIFIDQNYTSLLNLPIVFAGETLGLINMMAPAHHFDEKAVDAIQQQIPLAALALLAWRNA